MPIEKCTVNGKSGHRWGSKGKCYTGKDSKRKAAMQGLAEDGSEKFKQEMSKSTAGEYDAYNYIEFGRAIAEVEEAKGKIVKHENGWKILGQGKIFATLTDALEWKLGLTTADDNRNASKDEDEEAELRRTGAAKNKPDTDSDDDEDGLAEGSKAAKYYNNDEGADRPYLITDEAEPMPYKKLSRPKQILKETAKALYERSYGYITKEERDQIPQEDCAGPDKSYPCDTLEHFKSACKLYGRAENPDEIKKNIIKIAKRKGFKLPKSWQKEDK